MPKLSSFSATTSAVRSSSKAVSGWAWISRRHTVMSSWKSAMRLIIGMGRRSSVVRGLFNALRVVTESIPVNWTRPIRACCYAAPWPHGSMSRSGGMTYLSNTRRGERLISRHTTENHRGCHAPLSRHRSCDPHRQIPRTQRAGICRGRPVFHCQDPVEGRRRQGRSAVAGQPADLLRRAVRRHQLLQRQPAIRRLQEPVDRRDQGIERRRHLCARHGPSANRRLHPAQRLGRLGRHPYRQGRHVQLGYGRALHGQGQYRGRGPAA